MEIREINSTRDICKLLHIDYDEKTIDDIDSIIADNEEWPEFEKAFHEYYSEHGLGGDDKYEDCLNVLNWLLKDIIIYRPGDLVSLKGNSGFFYTGEILAIDNNKVRVKIRNEIIDTETDFIKARIRKADK